MLYINKMSVQTVSKCWDDKDQMHKIGNLAKTANY